MMDKDTALTATAKGCLSTIGLASIVGLGTALLVVVSILVPPWLKVKCQRREVLYYSEIVVDYETTFAGYHGLFASQDWQTEKSTPAGGLASGQLFNATEYRIFWGLLTGEWIAIAASAGSVFLFLAYCLHRRSNELSDKGGDARF